jgi:hypothetical protein
MRSCRNSVQIEISTNRRQATNFNTIFAGLRSKWERVIRDRARFSPPATEPIERLQVAAPRSAGAPCASVRKERANASKNRRTTARGAKTRVNCRIGSGWAPAHPEGSRQRFEPQRVVAGQGADAGGWPTLSEARPLCSLSRDPSPAVDQSPAAIVDERVVAAKGARRSGGLPTARKCQGPTLVSADLRIEPGIMVHHAASRAVAHQTIEAVPHMGICPSAEPCPHRR